MTTQKPDARTMTHQDNKAMPDKPAIKEPGTPPPPKEAQPSKQQQQQQQAAQGEYGEGNYKAARAYNEGLKRHMETHDIDKEARDAAPKSRQEADDMKHAEDVGLSHARHDNPEVKKNA